MDSFSSEQWNTILVIITSVVSLAGIIARNWAKKQDEKLNEAQTRADLAAAEAAKAKTDADSLNKLIDVLSMSQSSRERKDEAFLAALQALEHGMTDLRSVDTQRIEKASVTAAQVVGARDDIRILATNFEAGKNDAVAKVTAAMDDKLKPIELTLQAIQTQVTEALAFLHSVNMTPAAAPQEHHHSGSVELVPKAPPADTPADEPNDESDEPKAESA